MYKQGQKVICTITDKELNRYKNRHLKECFIAWGLVIGEEYTIDYVVDSFGNSVNIFIKECPFIIIRYNTFIKLFKTIEEIRLLKIDNIINKNNKFSLKSIFNELLCW